MNQTPSRSSDPLAALVLEELFEGASFLRYGDDDDVRYLAGPEALEALAWLATSVVVPILTGAASSIAYDHVKAERAPELQSGAVEEYRRQVNAALSESLPSSDDTRAELATSTLEDLLLSRGWPEPEAKGAANRIVAILDKQLS